MKKWQKIALITAVVILVVGSGIGATYFFKNSENIIGNTMESIAKKTIFPILDKEMEEMQEKWSLGEPTVNRKTVKIWEDMYEISRQTVEDGKILSLWINVMDRYGDVVLYDIINYKEKDDTLYVYSKEGYAVIRQSNVCRVYITIPPEEYEKGYYNENGMHCSYSKVEDCDFVRYLSSFDEFLKHEQKILKELAE